MRILTLRQAQAVLTLGETLAVGPHGRLIQYKGRLYVSDGTLVTTHDGITTFPGESAAGY